MTTSETVRSGTAALAALILIASAMTGCASVQRLDPPTVTLVQRSEVPDLRMNVAGGVPLVFSLLIENRFDYPVTLVSAELETAGQSGAYRMQHVRHVFSRVIPPHTTEEVELRAWIHPLQTDSRGRTDHPVLVRGSARFETPQGISRASFVSRAQ